MKAQKDASRPTAVEYSYSTSGRSASLRTGNCLSGFRPAEGEAAELAFEALVERHGPMVLRVCRAQLVDPHETQDAFQATFLILIQKARALWVRDSLGPWLHQVALRTASCGPLGGFSEAKA